MNRLFTLAVVGAALAVTGAEGAPGSLPDIALGSSVLFHLERLAALLAVLISILLMVQRAFAGQLPVELSTQGIKYAPGPVREEAVQALINDVKLLHEALSALEARVAGQEGED